MFLISEYWFNFSLTTEISISSDEIKTAYEFKGDAEGVAAYGNEAIKYKAGLERGGIVYVAKEDVYGGTLSVTHVGYHSITSAPQQNNAFYSSRFLGDSYKINVCSICGAYNKD